MKKILAVASGGGHWIQLLRLRPAFNDAELRYMTTNSEFGKEVDEPLYVVQDANINEKFKLICLFFHVLWILIRFRPDIVITTGAAPGLLAIFLGKVLGSKTIWIDSIANASELSGSGKQAGRFADVWLTQWEHIAQDGGPTFKGKVI